MSWYVKVLKNYAKFSGRARRKEYWNFILFNIIIGIVVNLIDGVIMQAFNLKANYLTGLYLLAMIIPLLAVTVRRLHDVGLSGWWYLVGFVPVIGPIWLLILEVTDSQPGVNQYGPNPKEAI